MMDSSCYWWKLLAVGDGFSAPENGNGLLDEMQRCADMQIGGGRVLALLRPDSVTSCGMKQVVKINIVLSHGGSPLKKERPQRDATAQGFSCLIDRTISRNSDVKIILSKIYEKR
jgi:hypothetical protein